MRNVPIAKARSGKEIEQRIQEIIKLVQPKALIHPMPFDIETFFEFDLERLTGVKPDYKLLSPGIHGYTDIHEMKSVISQALMDNPGQKRFARSTTAHESCHAIFHVKDFQRQKAFGSFIHDKSHEQLRVYREDQIKPYLNPEWQAWRGAKSLLVNEPALRIAYQQTTNKYELADIFDVHPAFIIARLKDLKMIPREDYGF